MRKEGESPDALERDKPGTPAPRDGRIEERSDALAESNARLRRSEARYRALFDAMDQGFCIIEKVATADGEPSDFRYVVANPAFARHTGLHDAVGKTILQLVPNAETRIMHIYDDVVRTGEPRHFEACVSALDLWIEAEVVPASGPHQIAVLFSNVSKRKRAEAALRESEERQKFLLELSDGLRTLSDPVDAMSMTAEMFGKQLGVAIAQFLLLDREENSLTPCGVYSDGRLAPGLAPAGRLSDHWPGLAPQFRAGEALFFDDHALRDGADSEAARGLRSGSAVPLVRDGRIVAIFSTADPEPWRFR